MSDKNIEVLQTHLDHWKRLLAEGEETIEAFQAAIEALKEPCEDAVSRQAVLDAITANCIWENEYNLTSSRIKNVVEKLPPVTPKPLDTVLDKIWAEIEPKCDRINSLASVLPYTAHREIQELLCEIMDLCKAESSKTEQGLAYADQETMMSAT